MTENAFDDAWQSWHTARLRTITAPHGLASLVATHWLSPEPQRLDGLDGEWYLDGAAIVGENFTIVQGGEVLVGGRILRHFRRDDQVALRVLDPQAPTRASVVDVDSYMPDEAWKLAGRFTPAAEGETVPVEEIDGYVEVERVAGTIALEINGQPVEFVATGTPQSMQVVFSDATSGTETYRFRFLRLHAEVGTDRIEVDFNRAYLPPCVFADFYVCPLPPTQNRLPMPVRAGEKNLIRR